MLTINAFNSRAEFTQVVTYVTILRDPQKGNIDLLGSASAGLMQPDLSARLANLERAMQTEHTSVSGRLANLERAELAIYTLPYAIHANNAAGSGEGNEKTVILDFPPLKDGKGGRRQGTIGGTLMMNTSLRVTLPQLLVKAMNLPSRLMSARGESQ